MKTWRYFDKKYMEYNGECPSCTSRTWVTDSPSATFYSGKKFYDVHKDIVGVWFASGLVFCCDCYENMENSINDDDLARSFDDD